MESKMQVGGRPASKKMEQEQLCSELRDSSLLIEGEHDYRVFDTHFTIEGVG